MTLWRIIPRAYASEIRKGLGGLYAAGRWHEKGAPVIYTAEHPGAAMLEILVNTSAAKLAARAYCVFEIEIPGSELIRISDEELPHDWRALPHPDSTRKLGTEWLKGGRSLALSVPSAVFPLERVVVLNPRHSLMPEVWFSDPQALDLDERLLRTS